MRGGAFSVLGDFVLGEFSRQGQRFTGYVAGPTGSMIDDVLAIKSQVSEGKNYAPTALNAAHNNLPLQNFFWTKAAFDAFVWSALMDHVQPGYTARARRRARQQGKRSIIGR